jgi:hypothetical protein
MLRSAPLPHKQSKAKTPTAMPRHHPETGGPESRVRGFMGGQKVRDRLVYAASELWGNRGSDRLTGARGKTKGPCI